MIRNLLSKSRGFSLRPVSHSTTLPSLHSQQQPKFNHSTFTKRKRWKNEPNNPSSSTSLHHHDHHHHDHHHHGELASTEWIQVIGIPPLSSLDEVLHDIERIMKTELKTGIVDLDAAEELIYHGEVTTIKSSSSPTNPLPLWNPSNHMDTMDLPDHMVIEAHLQLSTLYREAGWYLRFPNRSCVHAILSHVHEAQRIKNEHLANIKRMKRKEALIGKKKWDNTNLTNHHVENSIVEDDDDEDDEEHDYYQEIDKFSWMDYDTRPLTCGWKEVRVYPFHISTETFVNKIDWIDDTVVRIENCPAETTVDDIRYFLKQYNLIDGRITLNNNDDKDDDLRHLTKSSNLSRDGVTLVVSGSKNHSKNHPRDFERSTLSTTNTFLAKFVSASDARCAVREKQNVDFMGRKLRLAQFPRQIIP